MFCVQIEIPHNLYQIPLQTNVRSRDLMLVCRANCSVLLSLVLFVVADVATAVAELLFLLMLLLVVVVFVVGGSRPFSSL